MSAPASDPSESPGREVYPSCEYLQSGLSFAYASVRACAILHHGAGQPPLLEPYAGDRLSLDAVRAARAEIARQNRNGGHPLCRGCPFLVERPWGEPRHAVRWLGLTNWLACNIACDYCDLQLLGHAEMMRRGELEPRAYDVRPAVEQLLDEGWLSPDAIVDWGGGGEPTTMPGFDELLQRLHRHGAVQWLHTNAVRLPASVRNGAVGGSRLRVLCSVDAGRPATYAAMKQRDVLGRVWSNLAAYGTAGALVTVKYIVRDSNHGRDELDAFLDAAVHHGRPAVAGDIDFRDAEPSQGVVDVLAYLQWRCHRDGLGFSFNGVGANHAPEADVAARIAAAIPRIGVGRSLGWRRLALLVRAMLPRRSRRAGAAG